jgi:hypothetical protein
MDTMTDPAFIAEIRNRHLGLEPLSGEDVQRLVAQSVATPTHLVDEARRYIAPQEQAK